MNIAVTQAEKRTEDEKITALQRQLLLFYLRHPIGRQVITSWFVDAGAGRMGPGDLLDHKYPAHFKIFTTRCAEVSELCGKIVPRSPAKKLDGIINKLVFSDERAPFSLAPKDSMLVTLGAYLQANRDMLQGKRGPRAPILRLMYQFGALSGATPQMASMHDIAIKIKNESGETHLLAENIDQAQKTPQGYPLVLDHYPVMKTYPTLKKLAHEKNILWRQQLYELARFLNYNNPTEIIGEFLNGKIVRVSGKYANQLKPFAADVCEYLKGRPEILFAGTYPATRLAPPAKTSRALALEPIFLLSEMQPVLTGLHEKGIHIKHDLINALLATKKIDRATVYKSLPLFLSGHVHGAGPLKGAPTKLAILITEIAGCKAEIYDALKRRLPALKQSFPRGNGRKSSAPRPC